ncbi:MAG: hypothetical protein PF488_01390 [Patescibacteria group bacterium]|jgi:hypothetical protein|nr:hypothetical protein [Patescibacteria group bacterium]
MRKTINDLSLVKTAFIHVINPGFLEQVVSKIPENIQLVCSDENYIGLKNKLYEKKKKNEVVRLSQHNQTHSANSFYAFSSNSFLSVLYEHYESNDQSELNKATVPAFDLVVVDLEGKSLLEFSNSDLAAFFLLIAGVKNYSRVALVNDLESLTFFYDRVEINNGSKVNGDKMPALNLFERFILAQMVSSMTGNKCNQMFFKSFHDEVKKFELLLKS